MPGCRCALRAFRIRVRAEEACPGEREGLGRAKLTRGSVGAEGAAGEETAGVAGVRVAGGGVAGVPGLAGADPERDEALLLLPLEGMG